MIKSYTKVRNFSVKVFNFYVEGFKSMKLGKTLWLIILLKLFIMFCILRPFFFPRFLANHPSQASESEIVGTELVDRIVED